VEFLFDDDAFANDLSLLFAQIACGEAFSVALSDQGKIYTTGSSEYGQLGNGETGEYFVTASKLAFANEKVFTLRDKFVEQDPDYESSSCATR
jgi:alpha-tubulin suppressor-like RCC1 family protein